MPSRVLNFQTPCHTVLKDFPHTKFISLLDPKIFGCTAFVHLHSQNRSKLDPKSIKCIFLGYSSHQKGYKCYSPITRKMYNTMDVTFFENHAYYKSEIQGENAGESHLWDTIPSINNTSSPSVHHENSSDSQVIESQVSSSSKLMGSQIIEHCPNPPIALAPCQKPEIRVYTRRKKSGKDIEHTTHMEDHHASEPDPHSLETHSGLSNSNHDKILDGKKMKNEISALMKNNTWTITILPPGKRSVGCKWVFTVKYKADGSVERFKARLVAKGFTQTYGIDYQETFAPVAKLNTVRVLLSLAANKDWPLHQLDVKNAFLNGDLEEEVYMDIPPGFENSSNQNKVCKLKKSLYGLKQSPRAWFGRFTKAIIQNGYTQCQADHTLFVKFSSDKRIAILIVYVDDIILTGDYKEEMERLKEFLSKEFEIKDLRYLRYFLGMEIARSRHGIFVSQLSVVSQYMNNPTEEHMEAVTRILRYLKMNPRKVTWRSKKQSVVSRSSAEAEFRALALGVCEGIWLKRLLSELRLFAGESIKMLCDSQAAISIAKNPVHHDRTKHIEIDRHFITEKIENATIQTIYTPSRLQTADVLTKALPRTVFDELVCKLGMFDIHYPT
uniref:Uncharacterized protein n=1 Tax=Cannabis sativa TaxID=3483 RepID=A0A803QI12_CANSA